MTILKALAHHFTHLGYRASIQAAPDFRYDKQTNATHILTIVDLDYPRQNVDITHESPTILTLHPTDWLTPFEQSSLQEGLDPTLIDLMHPNSIDQLEQIVRDHLRPPQIWPEILFSHDTSVTPL